MTNTELITGTEISEFAWVLVKRYGDRAAFEVAMRADLALAEGDVDAAAAWRRILDAIERLQAKAPAEGEKVH